MQGHLGASESQRGSTIMMGRQEKMQKESRMVRRVFLNGLTWSTEKKHMRSYKGTFDIFLGIQHRRRSSLTKKPNKDGEAQLMQLQSSTQVQAVRIASHTSGGISVAVDGNQGAVERKEEGSITSIPGTGERIAQTWVNVRGGVRVSRCTSGTQMGPRGMKPLWKQW